MIYIIDLFFVHILAFPGGSGGVKDKTIWNTEEIPPGLNMGLVDIWHISPATSEIYWKTSCDHENRIDALFTDWRNQSEKMSGIFFV